MVSLHWPNDGCFVNAHAIKDTQVPAPCAVDVITHCPRTGRGKEPVEQPFLLLRKTMSAMSGFFMCTKLSITPAQTGNGAGILEREGVTFSQPRKPRSDRTILGEPLLSSGLMCKMAAKSFDPRLGWTPLNNRVS